MARGFQRPGRKLAPKPKIVIACEGKKTEYGYFHDLHRIERLTSVEVILLEHRGTDPRTVVRQVAQHIKAQRQERRWLDEDAAWAVFDGDEHQQTEGQRRNWHTAIDQAKALKIGLAISNPSFEFWYLLHYQDHFGALTRQKAKQMIEAHLPGYEKADRLYPVLQPLTKHAIARAGELERRAQRDELDEHQNPCCGGVAQLVKSLLKLKQA